MDNETLQNELKKQKHTTKTIYILIFCLLATFVGFMLGLKIGTPKNEYAHVTKVLKILEKEWYSEVYYDSYEDAPIAQFISSVAQLDHEKMLDPYTYLIKRQPAVVDNTGKMGVKIRNCFNSNYQLVKTVYPNSPAYKAGLQMYDLICGVQLKDNTRIFEDYSKYLNGEINDSITLLVSRYPYNLNEFLEIEVTFERFYYPTAYTYSCDLKDTLYVKLDGFVSNITGKNTVDELDFIFNQNQEKKYLILDLINNGGGALDSLVQICDLLLPAKKLISSLEIKDKSKTYYKTKTKQKYTFDQIFIYMNENTASASEMLIGCLDYYFDNLVIIGNNTYGKGIAQRTINLTPQYDFQYTFAKWFTPDNQWIQKVGFQPTTNEDKIVENETYSLLSKTWLDSKINLEFDQVDVNNLKQIQILLNHLYQQNLREDGYFDINTQNLVVQIQQQNQLETNGKIDELFLRILASQYALEITQFDNQYLNRTKQILEAH